MTVENELARDVPKRELCTALINVSEGTDCDDVDKLPDRLLN